MNSRIRLLVFLAVAIAVLGLAAPAFGVLPGRNGRIVFTSGRGGAANDDSQARIYFLNIVNPQLGVTPITPAGGQSRHGTVNPDRTRMAFANGSLAANNYDIFVKDLPNGNPTQITPADTTSADHPAWSPDNTRIAYEEGPAATPADRDIKVKTVGSASPAVNLTTGGVQDFKPAWSPDSQFIYYAKQNPNPQFLDIVKKPAGGGAETPVAAASGVDEYQPQISPDGTKICFTLQTTPGNTTSAEIYTASLPGLTGLKDISDDPTAGDINCSWSPDGNRIAFTNGVFTNGRLMVESANDNDNTPAQNEVTNSATHFDGNAEWIADATPDCPDTNVTTTINTPVTINLECADTGPLYEQTDPNGTPTDPNPTNGTLSDFSPLTNPSTVTYTPKTNFLGTDKVAYVAFDDFGFGTDKGTVTVTVKRKATPGGGEVFDGTAGNDNITGTPGPDVINCGAGDDTVDGGGGDDVINCGDGNDTVNGGDGNDTVNGENGNDRLAGGSGKDKVRGGAGNDIANGNTGRDLVNGDTGNDRINGDSDKDRVNGDSGNDKASGGSGNDRVSGSTGKDKVSGGRGNDRVAGNSGNDNVNGDSGNDRVSGGSGNDRVNGGSGNDKVAGDSGKDSVSGGSGKDRVSGGSGRDRCNGGSGRDRASRCERQSRFP